MFNFDDASKQSKEAVDGMLKSYSEIAKGMQAIATETADYSKKSFKDFTAHVEAMAGMGSVEAAYGLQADYAKSAYEGFVAQSSKMGDMYVELAKAAFKPYEAPFAKAVAAPNVA